MLAVVVAIQSNDHTGGCPVQCPLHPILLQKAWSSAEGPVLGCPVSQCPDPGHARLNQMVVSIMFFHSNSFIQIPFSSMQYGMHQFCYLQIPVGFWFPWTFPHMYPSSFHTWQYKVKLVTWYWHPFYLGVLNYLYPDVNWSGSADYISVFEQILHRVSISVNQITKQTEKKTWKSKSKMKNDAEGWIFNKRQ